MRACGLSFVSELAYRSLQMQMMGRRSGRTSWGSPFRATSRRVQKQASPNVIDHSHRFFGLSKVSWTSFCTKPLD